MISSHSLYSTAACDPQYVAIVTSNSSTQATRRTKQFYQRSSRQLYEALAQSSKSTKLLLSLRSSTKHTLRSKHFYASSEPDEEASFNAVSVDISKRQPTSPLPIRGDFYREFFYASFPLDEVIPVNLHSNLAENYYWCQVHQYVATFRNLSTQAQCRTK